LPLTGLILTRVDGDGRGGAALSMRHVTGLPIKFLGAGEKIDALDVFDARRVAGRILGQGDVVALVERAAQDLDQAQAERMAKKLAKGQFDLDDLSAQLSQMQKMGGMEGIMGLLPGVQKVKKQIAESGVDDSVFRRQQAIISSMTKQERKKPDILAASRKRRIAAGSGVDVAEVNRLLKQHRQMADMFKAMSKDGGKSMARMAGMLGGGDMSRLKAMGGGKVAPPSQDALGGQGLPGLPGLPGAAPKPGLLPGLGGGFNPFKKS
ncbi:MAG: RNA-binding protein, partial [Caulobacter sp.]|nr:RNA-binding protein [Caulobacter sp.]